MRGLDDDVKLRFLFMYRCVPHSTTDITPENSSWVAVCNQLGICSNQFWLKLLKGSIANLPGGGRVGNAEILKVMTYILETLVLVNGKWLTGKIVNVIGHVSFAIDANDGRFIRRHMDHIRKQLDVETPDILTVPASIVPSTNPLQMDIVKHAKKVMQKAIYSCGRSSGELRTSTKERYKPAGYGKNIYNNLWVLYIVT